MKHAELGLKMTMLEDELEQIQRQLADLRQRAVSELSRGRSVPGWRLAEGRLSARAWVDDADVLDTLIGRGLDADLVAPRRVLSPTALSKALGAQAYAAQCCAALEAIQQRGEPRLVREG